MEKVQERVRQDEQINGFQQPIKKIAEASDVPFWLSSESYNRILLLLSTISLEVSLKKVPSAVDNETSKAIVGILKRLADWIDEIPPKTGPRRFGNTSFRDWHAKLETELDNGLLSSVVKGDPDSLLEVKEYFAGSFGSKQRLDYGTGHELAFLAFVGGLYMLDLLHEPTGDDWLYIFSHYFDLSRKLVLTYTLEPAGSHGVWGLDDHFHLPYIFGSSELVDITQEDKPSRPSPKMVLNKEYVVDMSKQNLYFGAIQFILQVKRGPFHEHSPILYDVSAVATWHKIHRGMVKMYIAEVLGKYPVVQHFYFGGVLFPWTAKYEESIDGDTTPRALETQVKLG